MSLGIHISCETIPPWVFFCFLARIRTHRLEQKTKQRICGVVWLLLSTNGQWFSLAMCSAGSGGWAGNFATFKIYPILCIPGQKWLEPQENVNIKNRNRKGAMFNNWRYQGCWQLLGYYPNRCAPLLHLHWFLNMSVVVNTFCLMF